jgi:signal transduction histidine kinase
MSIRTKLLVLLFLVGLIPSAVAILILYRGAISTTQEAIGLELLERAQGTMLTLDEALQALLNSAQSLAEQIRHAATPAEGLANLPTPIEAAAITDCAGNIQFAQPPRKPELVATIPATLCERADPPSLFIDETTTTSGPPMLRLFVRLENHRYLVVACRLAKLLEPFRTSLPGDQTQLVLVTNRGSIVGPTAPPENVVRAVKSEATLRPSMLAHWISVPGEKSTQYLVAYRVSSVLRQRQNAGQTTLEWFAVAFTDAQFVLPALNALLWRMVGFGILLSLGLAALSVTVATTLVRPLRQLQQRVESVKRGKWPSLAPIRTGDELEELGQAFDSMIEEIRRSRDALEKQIVATQNRITQVELVNEVSRAILSSFSLVRLLETAEAQLANLVPIQSARLILFTPGESRIVQTRQTTGRAPAPSALIETLRQRQQESGKVTVALREDSFGPNVWVGVRLFAPPESEIGLLLLEYSENAVLLPEHESFLEQLAPFLSLAIRHVELYEQVSNLAAELEHKVEERAAQLEQAHRQLIQQERLAVTGQLAAGVAHEINNPLAIIKNMLQVMRLGQAPAAEAMAAIEEEIDRIARIVRSLLDFARPPAISGPPALVARDTEQVLALLGTQLRKRRITVSVDVPEDLPPLAMSSDHLRQVLMNLLRNAEQAIDEDGQIQVRARLVQRTNGEDSVRIEIEDNGSGISPEILPRIFEPFFTTKRSREGMGLGLAVTYGLVTASGGKITVNSQLGKGTTFIVEIPVCRDTSEEETPAP